MSTQQFQYPKSYYQLERHPSQQPIMNGSGTQGLNQTQQPGQSQGQPMSQQQLLSQYLLHPYSLYYNPGQLPMQQMQQMQQPQYQQYQQQSQQHQGSQASDYLSHYPGYLSSSGHYNQYPVYQQGQQHPQSQVYAPSQTQQVPSGSASSTAPSVQLAQPQAGSAATTTTGAPTSAKGLVSSDSLGGNANSAVGQYQPPGIRPRVTTTMWEDEKTLCYQVDANNVSVVRRADNNMINGTKLLNVAQMTRGRRDGILKLEKVRHVVKIGSMHLKGVWIPFERALAMAQREGIVDLLYPLFVRDIKRVIQTGVTPAALGNSNLGATSNAKNTPLVANSSSTYPAASASTASGAAAGSSNPNVGFYSQYPSQYPPAGGSGSGSGAAGSSLESSSAAPQQQGQQVGQQLMYPYSQPYFNQQQYYSYGQGSGSGGAGSSGYSGYSAPMYSYSYNQAPGQQHQGHPYQGQQVHQHAQSAALQPLGQQGSPDEKKADLKSEAKK